MESKVMGKRIMPFKNDDYSNGLIIKILTNKLQKNINYI
jgi:hypothetical protein